MRILSTALLAVVLAGDLLAGDDVKEVVADVQQAVREHREIGDEMKEATAALSRKANAMRSVMNELKNEETDPDRVERYKQEVAYLKQRLMELEAFLKAAKMSPAERKAKAELLEERIKTVRKELYAAQAPFRERQNAIRTRLGDAPQRFMKAMEPYFRVPEGDWPAKHVKIHGNPGAQQFFACDWYDGDRKKVAWAHVMIRADGEIRAGVEKLDGKYPIIRDASDGQWVIVGGLEIRFQSEMPEHTGKEKVREALKAFVDLEGLGALAD